MREIFSQYDSFLAKNYPSVWLSRIHVIFPSALLITALNILIGSLLPLYFNMLYLLLINLVIIFICVFRWLKFQQGYYKQAYNLKQHILIYFLNTLGMFFLCFSILSLPMTQKYRLESIDKTYPKLRENMFGESVVFHLAEKDFVNIKNNPKINLEGDSIAYDIESTDDYYDQVCLVNGVEPSNPMSAGADFNAQNVFDFFQSIQTKNESYNQIKMRGDSIIQTFNLPPPSSTKFTYLTTTYLNNTLLKVENMNMNQYYFGSYFFLSIIFICFLFYQHILLMTCFASATYLRPKLLLHLIFYLIFVLFILYYSFDTLLKFDDPQFLDRDLGELFGLELIGLLNLNSNSFIQSGTLNGELVTLLFLVISAFVFLANSIMIRIYYLQGQRPN